MGEGVMWLPFMQKWSKRFRVQVPQHPGFGASTGFDRIDAIEDMAFAYAELFDALGLEEFVLVGHSLGGWIAAEYAVRWPERVTKLVISAAPGLWVDEHPPPDLFRLARDRDAMRSLLFHDPTGAIASMILKDNPDRSGIVRRLPVDDGAGPTRLGTSPRSEARRRRLYRIVCPTLVLWGADDKLVPVAHGVAYHRLVPGSTFVTYFLKGVRAFADVQREEHVAKIMEFVADESS